MKACGGLIVLLLVCSPLSAGGTILEVDLLQTVEGSFSDMAVDTAGRFYLVDSRHSAVLVIRPGHSVPLVEFDLLDTAGRPLRQAVSICILSDNGMAVLDRADRKAVLYGEDGLPRSEISLGDAEPQAIARDAFDRLLVLDRDGRVLLFGTDGLFLGVLGASSGDGRFFNSPRSLTCDDHGNVFVLQGEGGQFQVLNPVGQVKTTALSREEGLLFLRDPRDVFVDPAGFLFVADADLDRCLVFSMDGFLGTFGTEGVGEGRFREPVCVASDGRGHVALGDAANEVVQLFMVDRLVAAEGMALQNWLLPPKAEILAKVEDTWQAAGYDGERWAAIADGSLLLADSPGEEPEAEATGDEFRRLSAQSRTAWDGQGSVWTADQRDKSIWLWAPSGGKPHRVSVPDKSFRPVDVALSPWGDVAIADGRECRIGLFDPSGAWSAWLVASARSRPVAVAFAPDTTLWVGLENGTLLALDRGGGIVREIVLDTKAFGRPRDIGVDGGGHLLVLSSSSLTVVDPGGQVLMSVGSRDRGALQWREAVSLAFGAADTLWVFEPRERSMVALGFRHVNTGAIAGSVFPPHRATVWATTGGERVASADVVPPAGSFTIAGLLPGAYSIDVEGPGLIPLRNLGQASVSPGRIWDLGRWELKEAAIVTGRLVPPDAGVSAVLQGEESCTALSGDGGSLLFEGVAPGAYHLQVTRDGFLPYRGDALVLAAGDSVWIGDVVLTNTGAMELDVVAPGAEALWANLWSSEEGWTSHSGPGGEPLLIEDLRPGVYRVVMTAPGFHPDSSLSEVALGEGEVKVLSPLQLTPFPGESGNWSKTVDQGVRAYERADFPSAVSYLERAVASDRLSYEDHARALLYLGLAAVALAEDAKARAAFREMCLVSPGCTLPPEYSSARLEALLEQSRPFQ